MKLLSERITFRLNQVDRPILERAADEYRVHPSEYIRHALIEALKRDGYISKKSLKNTRNAR